MINRKSRIQLKKWLNNCEVDTNKQMTSISRETFLLLYTYRNLMEKTNQFNLKNAKTLAFFVLSQPDTYLSNLIDEFDAYRRYLTTIKGHTSTSYNWTLDDLSSHDKLIMDAIFALYRPTDYDQMCAVVIHNLSFIFEKACSRDLSSNDISRMENIAYDKEMQNPIEVLNEKDGHYYLHDATHLAFLK